MTHLFHSAFFRLAFAALLLLGLPACRKQGGGKPADVDYYTCTMHPSVKSQKPNDKCPICSMDLVPVKKRGGSSAAGHDQSKQGGMKEGDMKGMKGMEGMPGMAGGDKAVRDDKPSEFTVPVERQQQIGVRYATVERKHLDHSIRAVGMVEPEPQRLWKVVSRVNGYIEQLNVSGVGDLVKIDQPLMTIYSPDLLTTQREFVDLLRMRDGASKGAHGVGDVADRLIDSARRRLRLWNVTDEQIAELEKTRKPQENLRLLSKVDGVVQQLPAMQGMNIKMGDPLVEVADLSTVRVWAEFYQEELPMIKTGQKVAVNSSSYPGEQFEGVASVVDPFITEAKRTGRVRIDIPNPELKLRPNMYVNVDLAMDMGEALVIPISAIMPTGKRNVAFVDKGEGKLEPRLLELGGKYGDFYAVTKGLEKGERVVASANFLIDAESKVQGAVKNFEGEGMGARASGGMGDHKHEK